MWKPLGHTVVDTSCGRLHQNESYLAHHSVEAHHSSPCRAATLSDTSNANALTESRKQTGSVVKCVSEQNKTANFACAMVAGSSVIGLPDICQVPTRRITSKQVEYALTTSCLSFSSWRSMEYLVRNCLDAVICKLEHAQVVKADEVHWVELLNPVLGEGKLSQRNQFGS